MFTKKHSGQVTATNLIGPTHRVSPVFKKRIAKWPNYILKTEGGGVFNLFLGGLKMALEDLKEGHSEGFVKVDANQEAVDSL